MSLINDALKRAREAQDQAARGADRDIELRPVEPGSVPTRKAGWVLPSVVTAAVLLAGFCIYQATRPSRQDTQVQARTTPPNAPATTPVVPTVPETTPAKGVVPTNIPATAPVPQLLHEQSAPAIPPERTASNSLAISATTIEAPATPSQPPAKPVFRLQGIVFHPTRPSAVINGKTVFVGDKIADKRVFAIDVDTVTVAGSGETNVLTLP